MPCLLNCITSLLCHVNRAQVWTGGFRRGPPAYSSFFNARVYEWTLGTPTARIPAGADAGALGMKEKGWRRLIIPAALAYGSQGLVTSTGKAGVVYAVPPDTPVYFDLLMVDGGSGQCQEVLHPPGVSDEVSLRLKSISCKRGAP